LKTLDALGEDADLLKSIYLDTLNINHAIQYGNKLKENREKAKQAEKAKVVQPLVQGVVLPTEQPAVTENTVEEIKETDEPLQPETTQPELLTRAFKVTTTRENIIALGDFMNEMGIPFEKIKI